MIILLPCLTFSKGFYGVPQDDPTGFAGAVGQDALEGSAGFLHGRLVFQEGKPQFTCTLLAFTSIMFPDVPLVKAEVTWVSPESL